MTPEEALDQIGAHADVERAAGAKAYHKSDRLHLGVPNPVLNDLSKQWRRTLDVPSRIALADGLWRTDIYEARVAAAKLLTQARIRPDENAWALIASWVPDFDSWAIADHACMAGQKRLLADPTRNRPNRSLDRLGSYVDAPCGSCHHAPVDQAEQSQAARH